MDRRDPALVITELARGAVRKAAAAVGLQPVAEVAEIPNTTNYVFVLTCAGNAQYIAKYSVLGLAKTSVARLVSRVGLPEVLERQNRYLDGRTVPQDEAEQLRFLNTWCPSAVPGLVGYAGGVLFEHYIHGESAAFTDVLNGAFPAPSIFEAIARTAAQIWDLSDLESARDEVGRFSASLSRFDIPVIFARKFTGVQARGYVDQVAGQSHHLRSVMRQCLPGLGAAAREWASPPARPDVVVGDLKPEHLILAGPSGSEATFKLIDPAVRLGDARADPARLLARLAITLLSANLLSLTDPPSGLADAAQPLLLRLPRPAHERELVDLMVLDALNILSTYATIPGSSLSYCDIRLQMPRLGARPLITAMLEAWLTRPRSLEDLVGRSFDFLVLQRATDRLAADPVVLPKHPSPAATR